MLLGLVRAPKQSFDSHGYDPLREACRQIQIIVCFIHKLHCKKGKCIADSNKRMLHIKASFLRKGKCIGMLVSSS
jgi:hypothetical protein